MVLYCFVQGLLCLSIVWNGPAPARGRDHLSLGPRQAHEMGHSWRHELKERGREGKVWMRPPGVGVALAPKGARLLPGRPAGAIRIARKTELPLSDHKRATSAS